MLNNNPQNVQTVSLIQRLKDKNVFEQLMKKHEKVTKDTPKGRLVVENPIEELGSSIVDTGRDVAALGKALTKGEATDTQLGRFQDLGMKLGGAAIAGVLAGSRATANKKLMEFIGAGTFFSTMALWPKLSIDMPTKFLYGFNPHQKVIDSNGDKKAAWLVNQFLPINDIMTKEDVNKVADKMGIPKNLEEREEYTKEKMRTIALQDNTLWMLSAGIAAPTFTSLVCNRAEEALRVPMANRTLKGVDKNIPNIEAAAKKAMGNAEMFKANDSVISEVTTSLRNGVVPEGLSETLAKAFSTTSNVQSATIRNSLLVDNSTAVEKFVSSIMPSQMPDFTALAQKLAGSEGEEAVKQAKELYERAYQSAVTGNLSTDIDTLTGVAKGMVQSNKALRQSNWAKQLKSGKLPENIRAVGIGQGYDKEALKAAADKIDEVYGAVIKPIQAYNSVFEGEVAKLNGVSGEKYASVTKTMLDSLGFTGEDIADLRNSTDFGDDLFNGISKKVQATAQDDKAYKRAMEALDRVQQKVGLTQSASKEAGKSTVGEVFDRLAGEVSSKIKGLKEGLSAETRASLEGSDLGKALLEGYSEHQVASSKSSIISVESMAERMKGMLTLERAMQDGSFEKKLEQVAGETGFSLDSDSVEDIKNLCRRVAWGSSYGDAMNKYGISGNGKKYQTVINTLFNCTEGETGRWQQAVRAISAEGSYIPDPALEFRVQNAPEAYAQEIAKTHKAKFADFGESAMGALKKQVNQVYNDRKWMKVFGGAAAALVGVTLISQLFFGKVRNAHLYKVKGQDNFQKEDSNGNK